jgi:hypothetical protein
VKRLRRILFNTLTAISLLLAIATAGLWVRSYWRAAVVSQSWQHGSARGIDAEEIPTYLCVHWGFLGGRFGIEGRTEFDPQELNIDVRGVTSGLLLPPLVFTSNGADFEVIIPGWILVPPFLVLPLVALLCTVYRSRAAGHCPACGYDMRANPVRCSECGQEPVRP